MSRGPAILIALAVGGALAFATLLALVALSYGFLWIFVFGDDPWPTEVEGALNVLVPVIGFVAWAAIAWTVYGRLRRR